MEISWQKSQLIEKTGLSQNRTIDKEKGYKNMK